MDLSNLLLLSVFLPLLAAALIMLASPLGAAFARWTALLTSIATFALCAVVVGGYVPSTEWYAVWSMPWLGPAGGVDIKLDIGLDGLSLWLYGLSGLLVITSVLVSWKAIQQQVSAYYALLLMLETGMLGVFVARDVILFYVFFEFTLIPLFFLIGVWGSEERRYAAAKFFLYTLAGSLITFLGLLAIVLWNANQPGVTVMTFSIPELTRSLGMNAMSPSLQIALFVALFAGFAIKVPLFPLHTWLPLAHVQAPTAGSVILAGILLKIGTYGFLRFNVAMLPLATAICAPWMLWLAVIGIIYGALVALAQSDMKRLIAYSSVSHLGYCMLGLFVLNRPAVQGGVLQMINHGLSTGGLFALVGMIYERYHTRQISRISGIAARTPVLAFFLVLFTLSSIGLPALNGFAGEFFVLLGMFQRARAGVPGLLAFQYMAIAVLAVFGVVLGAWYMLWLVQRVLFGPLREPDHDHHAPAVRDLSPREVLALAPLVVFIFWIGLCPNFFLKQTAQSLDAVTARAARQFDEQFNARSQAIAQKAIHKEGQAVVE